MKAATLINTIKGLNNYRTAHYGQSALVSSASISMPPRNLDPRALWAIV
jgi:hypothetical protein